MRKLATKTALGFYLVASLLPGSTQAQRKEPSARVDKPRLILLISVDQLGRDIFGRMRPLFRDGLKLLLDRGVDFPNTEIRYAITETAPGHATLSTGMHPRRHGIIGNWWLEPGEPAEVLSVDDDVHDKSPGKLLRSTLGDWLKTHDPGSKVVAASSKDRSAIFLGGRQADAAVWFDEEIGQLISSTYYQRKPWLEDFDSLDFTSSYFGRQWMPLPLEPDQLEGLEIEEVDMGPRQRVFPHAVGPPQIAPAEDFYDGLWDSPWLDDLLARFAHQALRAEDLGTDSSVDLLALSFSASDAVGHDWGPNSREHVDVLLRLDKLLGELFDYIDRTVGLEHTIVALSADHGAVPAPEVRRKRGEKGERPSTETITCVQSAGRRLAEAHGVDRWMIAGPVLDPELEARTGLSRQDLEARTAAELEKCPSVENVWTRSELLAEHAEDPIQQMFANSFNPERSPDFLIQFEEYFMNSLRLFTTHGTVYTYDREVPLLILAPGLEPRTVDQPVATIDLAPTLASLAGIPYPEDLDGTDLTPLMLRSAGSD
jgi:predicted AlkP superfamily pyrophosphatase or phosphodiesterase